MRLLFPRPRPIVVVMGAVAIAVAFVAWISVGPLAAALLAVIYALVGIWRFQIKRLRARATTREVEQAYEHQVQRHIAQRLEELRLGRRIFARPGLGDRGAARSAGVAASDADGQTSVDPTAAGVPAAASIVLPIAGDAEVAAGAAPVQKAPAGIVRHRAGVRLRPRTAGILVAVSTAVVIGVAWNAASGTLLASRTPAGGPAVTAPPSIAPSGGPSLAAVAPSPASPSPSSTEAPVAPTASAAPSSLASTSPIPVGSPSTEPSPTAVQSEPPPAQIEITPSTRVINLGGTFEISVRVLASGANRTVTLQSQPGYTAESEATNSASWTYLATLITDASGNATYTDSPPDSRYYRVSFAGAQDLGAAVSPRARALVRQVYALQPSNDGQVANVAIGTVVEFTSTVRPLRPLTAPAKATFVVYRHVGDAWVLVTSYDTTIDPAGHAHFSYTFATQGAFYVRSVARPTPENANSIWTPVERYDVG